MSMFYPGGGFGPASRYYMTAYDVARKNGFEGTPAEWIASLKGEQGDSAYQVAVNHGYTGTEAQFAAAVTAAPNSASAAASSATAASGSATAAAASATSAAAYLAEARTCVPADKVNKAIIESVTVLPDDGQVADGLYSIAAGAIVNPGVSVAYKCDRYTVTDLIAGYRYTVSGSNAGTNYPCVVVTDEDGEIVYRTSFTTADNDVVDVVTLPATAKYMYVNRAARKSSGVIRDLFTIEISDYLLNDAERIALDNRFGRKIDAPFSSVPQTAAQTYAGKLYKQSAHDVVDPGLGTSPGFCCAEYDLTGISRVRVTGTQPSTLYWFITFVDSTGTVTYGTVDSSATGTGAVVRDIDVPSGAAKCYVNGRATVPYDLCKLVPVTDIDRAAGSIIEARKTADGIVVKDGAFEYSWVHVGNNGILNWQSAKMEGTQLFAVLTDWIGPYRFVDLDYNDGDSPLVDGSTTTEITGGNHLLNASVPASKTGSTTQFNVFADLKMVEDGNSVKCKQVEIRWVNKICAGNTAKLDGTGRYALEEHCVARFVGGGRIEVEVTFRPLDRIKMLWYGGMQFAGNSFASSVYIPEYSASLVSASEVVSPLRNDKVVSNISVYGENASILMHMDREYGIGRLSNSYYAHGSGSKMYFDLYENRTITNAPTLESGGLYSWRGYYQLKRGSW